MQAQQIVDLLNAAAKLDPVAIEKLCETRVECSLTLADADQPPFMYVVTEDNKVMLGLVGILNGLVDADKERVAFETGEDRPIEFFVATPSANPVIFGLVAKQQTYAVKKDGTVEVTTEVVPVDPDDPLYQATKAAAEANPGMIACGTQANKKGDEPGQIQTVLIPPNKGNKPT